MDMLRKIGYSEKEKIISLYEAIEWLRVFKSYYVMSFPVASSFIPYYKWKVMIIILDKPNTFDGKMNMTELEKCFNLKEDADEDGLNTILKMLCDAIEIGSKMSDEELEELRNECRKKGFDI